MTLLNPHSDPVRNLGQPLFLLNVWGSWGRRSGDLLPEYSKHSWENLLMSIRVGPDTELQHAFHSPMLSPGTSASCLKHQTSQWGESFDSTFSLIQRIVHITNPHWVLLSMEIKCGHNIHTPILIQFKVNWRRYTTNQMWIVECGYAMTEQPQGHCPRFNAPIVCTIQLSLGFVAFMW